MAQFTERLKEELAAEELCRQANMTDVDTIDDLVELYRPRSQGDMSDSSGRDSTSLVPLADDSTRHDESLKSDPRKGNRSSLGRGLVTKPSTAIENMILK